MSATTVPVSRAWDLMEPKSFELAAWVDANPGPRLILMTSRNIDLAGASFQRIISEAKEAAVIDQTQVDAVNAEIDRLNNPSFGDN